jgi:hypothetical protein
MAVGVLRLFGDTNYVEHVNLDRGAGPAELVRFGLTQDREAAESIRDGEDFRGESARHIVDLLGETGRELGGKAAVLKPLARVCVACGIEPSEATLGSIREHAGLLGQCEGDEATHACFVASRGREREELWRIAPLDTPETVREYAPAVREILDSAARMPEPLRGELESALRDCTGREPRELHKRDELIGAHAGLVVEVLGDIVERRRTALLVTPFRSLDDKRGIDEQLGILEPLKRQIDGIKADKSQIIGQGTESLLKVLAGLE